MNDIFHFKQSIQTAQIKPAHCLASRLIKDRIVCNLVCNMQIRFRPWASGSLPMWPSFM